MSKLGRCSTGVEERAYFRVSNAADASANQANVSFFKSHVRGATMAPKS